MSTAKNKNAKPLSFSSTTLVKAAFLCGVLAEDPHCHHLAFRVGIFGLEIPRQPAKSKALEVRTRLISTREYLVEMSGGWGV